MRSVGRLTDGALAWGNAAGDFSRREGMPPPPVLTARFASKPKWVDLTAYRDGADPVAGAPVPGVRSARTTMGFL